MDFTWDESKAHSNLKKHGVSFKEATEVFGDEFSSCVPDPDHSVGEDRYLLFGTSSKGRHLVVSFTERIEVIRIISVRHMTRKERGAYES
ncbi:BrnT family toxin [Desulfonatronum lacustre]|uniref:BrnT family toxin n=1 Tax=Desulfonatronum lacustre TaxID=66849 RepID=UPI0009FC038B|nr:BrnT family toxin [Desulfonatronum lacustre]